MDRLSPVREMSVLQKAACEAIWRDATEHQGRYGNLLEDTGAIDARYRLAKNVSLMPADMLHKLVQPLVSTQGPLKGGFSMRWNSHYLRVPYKEPSERSKAIFEEISRHAKKGSTSSMEAASVSPGDKPKWSQEPSCR